MTWFTMRERWLSCDRFVASWYPCAKHRPRRRPPKGVFGHRTRRQEQLIAAVTPPSTARARPRGKGKEARRRKIQARNGLRTEADGAPREKKSVRLLDRWIAGGKKSTYLTIRTGVQRDPARFEARTRQESSFHFLHASDFGRELCLSTPNGNLCQLTSWEGFTSRHVARVASVSNECRIGIHSLVVALVTHAASVTVSETEMTRN